MTYPLLPRPMFQRLLVSVLMAAPLAALAGPVMPQGVWSGTLGTKAIVACFNGSPMTGYGSYYYLDHLTPISLTTREKDDAWHEEDETGLWIFTGPASRELVGQWKHPKTGKTLPIRLSVIDGSDDEAACARDSYNQKLEAQPPAVKRGPVETFAPGRTFRKITFAGQETVELQGPDAGLDKLNAQLKLDRSPAAVDAYFQQRREFLGRVGYPAVDERHTDPTWWDANFITLKFYTWAAGEGRRGISMEHRTWNVRTGEPVDPWRWIGASAERPKLPATLRAFLYKGLQEEADCKDGYQGQGAYTLTFDTDGLHFDEEAWGNGCEKSLFLPFDKAQPYLTPAGRQAAAALRQGGQRPAPKAQ